MILDFLEIPQGNLADGRQDTFEMFSRDFFSTLGYKVLEEPCRGADGGIDFKILEKRVGISGETEIRWLVSCKHYAKSGSSVKPNDEINILERVELNKCSGFIGFYSSITSAGLNKLLYRLTEKIHVQIFDKEKIESEIVGLHNFTNIFRRYFPKSFEIWTKAGSILEPINLFEYYLEKKFSGSMKHLLSESIYFSTGNMIKAIRTRPSFVHSIADTRFILEIVDWSFTDFWNDAHFFENKMLDRYGHYDYTKLYFEFHSFNGELLFAYNNYLFINEIFIDVLENQFVDFKHILE